MTGARVDRVVAALLGAAGLASLVVTTDVAYRSWDAAAGGILGVLWSPAQSEALWTGLVAANLMLLQVVLLARLPWLERAWGRGTLTRLHLVLGVVSFWLMLWHVVLFAVQRAGQRPGTVGSRLLDVFVRDEHMLIASIGTVLLVVVAVSSIRAVRRRLRYEVWHLTHLWSYVGIGLVLPHELVSVDLAVGWERSYWWALHLVPAALVLLFRVARPLLVSRRHRLRVGEVVTEAPGVTSLVVTGRDLERLGARSGQFLLWRFGGRGRTRGHPYSLSRAPDGRTLRVTVGGAADRDGAAAVAAVVPGARVLVEGPYGHLADLVRSGRRHPHLLLAAAGVGITPIRAVLEDAPYAAGEVTLLQRASTEEQLLHAGEIDEIARRRGVRVVRLVGPRRSGWSFLPAGHEGRPADELLDLAPDLLTSDVVVCGPDRWAWGLTRAALDAGVRRRDLHREEFGW